MLRSHQLAASAGWAKFMTCKATISTALNHAMFAIFALSTSFIFEIDFREAKGYRAKKTYSHSFFSKDLIQFLRKFFSPPKK